MAKSAPAPRRASAPTPATDKPFAHARNLAFKVMDAAGYVTDTHQAYEALEKLVTPTGSQDREVLELDRSELGALLRTLNKEQRERVREAEEFASDLLHHFKNSEV